MVVANLALGIDQVMRRPVAVIKGAPDLVIIVDCHRVIDLEVRDGLPDIVDFLFKGEFGCVDTDDDKALIAVFVCPRPHIWNGADAVDAGIGPEVDEDDLATQLFARERWGI
ncbi:hypothetical protein D3C78_1434060 [compost metagenome]